MKVSEIKTNQINLIVGTVAYFGRSSVPKGWLECNGASLIRNDFIDLFNIIGTTYGSVDANSFNLPDLRGEFIRCWDNGRGVDKYPTYTYGGSTTESNRQFNSNVQSYATKTIIGSMYKISETFANYGSANGPMWRSGGYYAGNTPNHVDSSGTGSFEFNSSRVSNSSLGETRPRNIALLACIKY